MELYESVYRIIECAAVHRSVNETVSSRSTYNEELRDKTADAKKSTRTGFPLYRKRSANNETPNKPKTDARAIREGIISPFFSRPVRESVSIYTLPIEGIRE